VTELLRKRGLAAQISGVGSLFCLHWTDAALSDYRSSRPADPSAPLAVFMGLLNQGIMLTQRGMGACSLAMSDADVDHFVIALGRVLDG
jgi:glutamate-1-semialdehyde 2,1-aminomutase